MTIDRRRLLLPAALAALVLGGCAGGDERLTKAEYEEQVQAVYGEVQAAFLRTNVAIGELPDRVENAQAQLREAASELEGVEPPDDVRAEHAQVAEAMRAYAEDLDALRGAAERGDQVAIEAFNSRVGQNAAIERMAEAAERMRFKGYDLGPIAEE